MPASIRPLTVADYPRVVAIEDTISNEPGSVESLAHAIKTWNSQFPCRRLVAEVEGRVVAYGTSLRAPWFRKGDMMIAVVVDPGSRGRGIGRALHAALEPFALEHRPSRLMAEVRDNDPGALAWAERRGFVKKHHIFDSHMDPARFDESRFPGVVDGVFERGIRFIHFDAVQGPETVRQLFDTHHRLLRDVPNSEDVGEGSFDDWRQWLFESPSAWPAACIIAVDAAGTWCGFTSMHRNPKEPHRAHVAFTGVEREHRGIKLALALKLVGIRFAREHGITQIITNNHSANGPMLAVNRKLGYEPLPGFHVLYRSL